ncbi:hypothetical protein DFS34DRAFT_682628 [Phlyctochytrium arcticum]|nr:hypothetical protein DFS34DRAFT_682628 [Phlyctochytrium arcticum]
MPSPHGFEREKSLYALYADDSRAQSGFYESTPQYSPYANPNPVQTQPQAPYPGYDPYGYLPPPQAQQYVTTYSAASGPPGPMQPYHVPYPSAPPPAALAPPPPAPYMYEQQAMQPPPLPRQLYKPARPPGQGPPKEDPGLFPENSKVPRNYGKKRSPSEYEPRQRQSVSATMARKMKKLKRGCCMRNFCCCIPRSKRGKTICCLFTFVFLAGVGVALFFLFPRSPDIQFLSLDIANLPGGGVVDFNLPSATDPSLKVLLGLSMRIQVFSDNVYNVNMERIDVTASVDTTGVSKETPKQLGKGNKTNIMFPSKRNTEFDMGFTLQYESRDGFTGLATDPAFNMLLASCGVTSFLSGTTAGKAVKINYVTTVSINPLNKLGIKPALDGSFNFPCPFAEEGRPKLQAALQGVITGTFKLEDLASLFRDLRLPNGKT